MRYAPHRNSVPGHTAYWKKDGPVSWDVKTSSQKRLLLSLPSRTVPGRTGRVAGCSIIRKRNLPPSPYTDAELVGFMDRNGLGTVATRANIICTLLERKYIRYSGKYVIPTPKGLFFYETVRGMK